jgi:hypothetical protein
MRIGKVRLALLVLLCSIAVVLGVRRLRVTPLPAANSQKNLVPKAKPDFALLPATEIKAYEKYYRANLAGPLDNWEPTVGDINGLEANLPQITALSGKQPDPGRHIDNPHQYFRQYLAIAQGGKKRIFVDAFCNLEPGDANAWRKHLVFVNDGGKCYWQAIYDPATQAFSNLTVNGVG